MATLSQRFLEQFVLDLIVQKLPKQERKAEQEIAEVLPIEIEKPSPIIREMPIQTQIPRKVFHPLYPAQQPSPNPSTNQNPSQQISLSSNSFDKVSKLLQDPRVQGVECTGANKNLLVNTDGAIKSANVLLTKEEIDSIMQEISQKTRIPLINGVFKAAFNNYVLTAVVSEFIGTRFVIQKRSPFQPLRIY